MSCQPTLTELRRRRPLRAGYPRGLAGGASYPSTALRERARLVCPRAGTDSDSAPVNLFDYGIRPANLMEKQR